MRYCRCALGMVRKKRVCFFSKIYLLFCKIYIEKSIRACYTIMCKGALYEKTDPMLFVIACHYRYHLGVHFQQRFG